MKETGTESERGGRDRKDDGGGGSGEHGAVGQAAGMHDESPAAVRDEEGEHVEGALGAQARQRGLSVAGREEVHCRGAGGVRPHGAADGREQHGEALLHDGGARGGGGGGGGGVGGVVADGRVELGDAQVGGVVGEPAAVDTGEEERGADVARGALCAAEVQEELVAADAAVRVAEVGLRRRCVSRGGALFSRARGRVTWEPMTRLLMAKTARTKPTKRRHWPGPKDAPAQGW